MGLKYEVFMIKDQTDEIKSKLLTIPTEFGSFTDTTQLMLDLNTWEARKMEWFDHMRNPDVSNLKRMEAFDLWKNGVPEQDALNDYMKRRDRVYTYYIWWMTHPTNHEYIVGGHSSIGGDTYWLGMFIYALKNIGLGEFLRLTYHHGDNGGRCTLIYPKTISTKAFKVWKSEAYRFERYARRIDAKTGYPIVDWNEYVREHYRIPWEVELELILRQPSEPEVEKIENFLLQ